MHYSQDELIMRIAEKTHYTPNVIKDVFKGCKEVLTEMLQVNFKEYMEIDIFSGLKIRRSYTNESRFFGDFKNMEGRERVKIRAIVSHRFKEKINNILF